MSAFSQLQKSFVLRVASAAPLDRAQAAAIMASNWLIGLPASLLVTGILAYTSAASPIGEIHDRRQQQAIEENAGPMPKDQICKS